MQKTVMRCCVAVLTFVALVLEMTTPKIENESTQQTSFEPRWTQDSEEKEDHDAETASTNTNFSEEATDISVEEEDTASIEAKIDNANTEETKKPLETPRRRYTTRVHPMGCPNHMTKTQVEERKAAIYALNERILALFQAYEEADKAEEEAAKAKEEAAKAEEEAAKAKEETAKNCQEIPTTQEDCSLDDLDDPDFCCQSRISFSRVLDQLKQIHVDFGYCAGVADHLHEEPTPSQQDVQPPATHAKKHKTIARASKRVQGEAGDPRATKKRRICRRVRFSFPTVKRHAMDDAVDVSRAKRRRINTTDANARSFSEMEVLQWIEHEKRVFRKEMVAEAKNYNDMVRLQRQMWKTPQEQPRGSSPESQANPICSPVVTSTDATAMENDCAPSIIPIIIKSAKENTCPPPIVPIVIKSAKENTCSPPIIPIAMKSAKENSRPPIVPVVDASAKRRRH
ncbi:hypothetical protein AeNC1_004456 [Aphanomyces euteiches]|nr:hypothetical protein AeNC1_004456 [Aphanomyces euteiches]